MKAAKAYEDHVARNGQPDSHARAKEIMYVLVRCRVPVSWVDIRYYRAGLAGAFVDREVESKGLDFVDKERAKYKGELWNCGVEPSSRHDVLTIQQLASKLSRRMIRSTVVNTRLLCIRA